MTDLIAFLNARMDEDEATANCLLFAGRMSGPLRFVSGYGGPAADAFIARHDPARVLREVEAKRLIIAAHNTTVRERMRSHPEYGQDYWCDTCSHENPTGRWCRTLLLLAAIYSDHPDYRQEWKP